MKQLLFLITIFSFTFAGEYEDWLKAQESGFEQYKKTLDDEFAQMLKKEWEAFKSMYSPTPYKKPKPKKLPKIKKEIKIPKKELKKSIIVKLRPIKEPRPKKVVKKVPKPKIELDLNLISFDFFSQNININYNPGPVMTLQTISKNSISSFWKQISKTKTDTLIDQINNYEKSLNLNDWAKYLFVYKVGLNIYKNKNMANLFSWFILSKMGYDTKVGYNQNNIYLLAIIKHPLYQVAFFNLGNKRYYTLTPNGKIKRVGQIYTYKGNYPKANKALSFELKNPIMLQKQLASRTLKFKYLGKPHELLATYSKSLVDFYKTFPQSDYSIYFKAKISPLSAKSLLTGLQPLIKGKTELEAVNLLLRFVQTTFKYKTDDEQFAYEKVFFPEETLFYPYSDCEDRSIIFSFLVKNLIGLDVVGLKYSDHLATAVAFSTKISGDSFIYKGKRYTISDPTYINANAGMTMPQYKHSNFKVIR